MPTNTPDIPAAIRSLSGMTSPSGRWGMITAIFNALDTEHASCIGPLTSASQQTLGGAAGAVLRTDLSWNDGSQVRPVWAGAATIVVLDHEGAVKAALQLGPGRDARDCGGFHNALERAVIQMQLHGIRSRDTFPAGLATPLHAQKMLASVKDIERRTLSGGAILKTPRQKSWYIGVSGCLANSNLLRAYFSGGGSLMPLGYIGSYFNDLFAAMLAQAYRGELGQVVPEPDFLRQLRHAHLRSPE